MTRIIKKHPFDSDILYLNQYNVTCIKTDIEQKVRRKLESFKKKVFDDIDPVWDSLLCSQNFKRIDIQSYSRFGKKDAGVIKKLGEMMDEKGITYYTMKKYGEVRSIHIDVIEFIRKFKMV